MFNLHDVEKRYENDPVLRAIRLRVEPKKTTVLIGPSGSGKSTLLRVLIGLVVPELGTVTFDGRSMASVSLENTRLRMGYVIQDGGLFPHLDAARNVALVAHHLRWPMDRIERRLGELSELVRLPRDALARYPSELSGGQRQRVGLMRALMLDPDVILLDEPLGALDPMVRRELQIDLRTIFRALKKTVVLVTHDMGEAAFFGDSIVLMRSGSIVQQGTFEDLLLRPSEPFVEAFIRAQRNPLDTESDA